jgi:hypothetical protein
MRRVIVLALVLTMIAAACSSEGDSSADDTSTTTSAAASTTEASGNAVSDSSSALVIASVDFDAGLIVLRNDGGDDYDLAGHWICNRPTYSQLPDEVLAPGGIVEIDAAVIGLTASSGEIALYKSREFGSADDVLRYVQWGTDSHGRTGTAVAGGVWQDGDFVDNQGGNIESIGSNPISAADWSSTS